MGVNLESVKLISDSDSIEIDIEFGERHRVTIYVDDPANPSEDDIKWRDALAKVGSVVAFSGRRISTGMSLRSDTVKFICDEVDDVRHLPMYQPKESWRQFRGKRGKKR